MRVDAITGGGGGGGAGAALAFHMNWPNSLIKWIHQTRVT